MALRPLAEQRSHLDVESTRWLAELTPGGRDRPAALGRLHELLVRIAIAETIRRAARLRVGGPELNDLAHQAADDALLAITGKLDDFRGDSRFTTWAYKFVIFEVAGKINQHFWQKGPTPVADHDVDRLPAMLDIQPEILSEWRELLAAVRHIVQTRLTVRQREVFVAVLLRGVPVDILADRLKTNRNAIYKTMFEARRKVREALVADGHLPAAPAGRQGSES